MPWPIPASPVGVRRGLGSVLALGALGAGALLATMPTSATAAPDPCAASQIAKTVGAVANNTGSYLDAHPQTNQALTTISQQQAGPQTLVALKSYFDANPQAAKDLQAIQQPLTGLSTQCKLPVSLPQLLGLMQTAQSGGATPAQAVAVTPATSAVSAVPVGAGPLPGPAASSTR
ncbi:hemophore [Mycolicibacterium anyangense]|uniref:Hemophore n=1 Tax=Mycolicibacterium anyangense TaxID=1431246 RepID=A0A6N4WD63_9MYCO|nr:hemophore [Mycolicibacterium anyangense]BBZ78989.1 hemophore [Mycolicibacterium anyangense]